MSKTTGSMPEVNLLLCFEQLKEKKKGKKSAVDNIIYLKKRI